MTTIFLIIAIIALVVLILSAVLDGLFEVFEFDIFDGIIGPISLSAFFATFGFAGSWFSSQTDFETLTVVIIAAVIGMIAFIPIGLTMKFLTKSESGIMRSDALIGVKGTVITDIKEGAYGQVRLNHSGHLVTMTATADEEIPSPTQVTVVSTASSIIHVERFVPQIEKTSE